MTDAYDDDDLDHRRIRLAIEQGDGIARMFSRKDGIAAIQDAGFDLEHHEDLAAPAATSASSSDLDAAPWYWPLSSDFRYAQTLGDLLTVARMNKWGRVVAHNIFSVMEAVWLAPRGTRKTAESLGQAADALVEGGRKGLFTPMYLMVGRKPGPVQSE
jgi:sterol 24-C-methyltransferase